MKYLLIALFYVIGTLQIAAQVTPESVFFIGRQAYDVNTMELLPRELWPEQCKKGEGGNFYVAIKRMLIKYNNKGEKLETIRLGNGDISPSFDYSISSVDNNLVRQDFINGKLSAPRTLTDQGVFQQLKYSHWHADNLYVTVASATYKLNTTEGVLAEYDGPYLKGRSNYLNTGEEISPSGRFALQYNDKQSFSVYDFSNGHKEIIPHSWTDYSVDTPVWLNDESMLLLFNQDGRNAAQKMFSAEQLTFTSTGKLFGRNSFERTIPPVKMIGMRGQFAGAGFLDKVDGRSRCVSTEGNNVLLITNDGKSITCLNVADKTVKDIFTDSERTPIEEVSHIYSSYANAPGRPGFVWVSDTQFVYARTGNLLKTGTYVYDVVSETDTKIMPVAAEKLLFMPEKKVLLTVTNGKISTISTTDYSVKQSDIDNVSYHLDLTKYKLIK